MSLFKAKRTATAISIYGPNGTLSYNLLTSFSEEEVNKILTNYTGADPVGFIKNEEEKRKEGIDTLLVTEEEESDEEYFGRRAVPNKNIEMHSGLLSDDIRDKGNASYGIVFENQVYFWIGHNSYSRLRNTLLNFLNGSSKFLSSADISVGIKTEIEVLTHGGIEKKSIFEFDTRYHFLFDLSDYEGKDVDDLIMNIPKIEPSIYYAIEKLPSNSGSSKSFENYSIM